MLDNCFRFAPRDSIPGLIAKICKYLKDHPGWSDKELEDQIKKFISANVVESFNGRTGTVTLDKNDVNNLKIASAYFAEGHESIDSLDIVSLYNQGVRFVFTDFNSVTSGYNLAFVLDYLSGSGDVVYYPMSTGSGGGGNIVSVNGKTGVVQLSLADIVGTSGVQVKLCTAAEFASATTSTWNEYYNEGYRIVGVVNSSATAIDSIYLLKQDGNNHTPIGLSTGSSDAYTPTNPPPYPVSSVNGKTGQVGLKVVDVSKGNSTDVNAYIFIDEDEEYPEVVAKDSEKLSGKSIADIMLAIYPVGSVYISVNSASPASLFGGTWEQINGRFLISTGAPENNDDGTSPGIYNYAASKKGGEQTHTLVNREVPILDRTIAINGDKNFTIGAVSDGEYNGTSIASTVSSSTSYQFKVLLSEYGGDQPHNNMPPYLAVNMWKRVS